LKIDGVPYVIITSSRADTQNSVSSVFDNCTNVLTRMKHPETNVKAERFAGLIRNEALRPNSPAYYGEGIKVIEKFIDEYNNNRYHAAIGYLKPVDVFHGRGPAILAERREKLN